MPVAILEKKWMKFLHKAKKLTATKNLLLVIYQIWRLRDTAQYTKVGVGIIWMGVNHQDTIIRELG